MTPTGGPRWVAVARIVKPHGTGGEVRMEPLSDVPERFGFLREASLAPARTDDPGAAGRPAEVESIRWVGRELVAKLAGVDGLEAAEPLRGWYLKVPESDLAPLPEGHFYVHQLLGAEVRDTAGVRLGVLADVLRRPANDVFVVRADEGSELLVPALKSVVARIDADAPAIVVRPLDEWL